MGKPSQSLRLFPWALFLVLGAMLPHWVVRRRFGPFIHSPEEAPPSDLAIVFGAGLRRDGKPTTVLAERVKAAVSLYSSGKVHRILMSGATDGKRYDEPRAMQELALELGIPAEDILVDRGGVRTFETCERAATLFHVRRALLVSQRYHLPRALAICHALGIQVHGVAADMDAHNSRSMYYWKLREVPATLVALCEALWRRPSLPSS